MNKIKAVLALILLAGCANNKVPLEIVDQNMVIAQANAQENAQAYANVV